MKVVKRLGVFETNSSSTHSLVMVSRGYWDQCVASDKRKIKKYNALTSKKDKLYMACGCCEELFQPERVILEYWCPRNKRTCKRNTRKIKENSDEYVDADCLAQEVAVDLTVEVYCKLTGEDFEAVKKEIVDINRSGRACHMKFFEEGALYDERYDYDLIYKLFDCSAGEIRENLERYFNDENVLLYTENYQGYEPPEDDDDE